MTERAKARFVVREEPCWGDEMEPFRRAMEAACREAGYPQATATLLGTGVFVSGDVPPEVVEKAWQVCRSIGLGGER